MSKELSDFISQTQAWPKAKLQAILSLQFLGHREDKPHYREKVVLVQEWYTMNLEGLQNAATRRHCKSDGTKAEIQLGTGALECLYDQWVRLDLKEKGG